MQGKMRLARYKNGVSQLLHYRGCISAAYLRCRSSMSLYMALTVCGALRLNSSMACFDDWPFFHLMYPNNSLSGPCCSSISRFVTSSSQLPFGGLNVLAGGLFVSVLVLFELRCAAWPELCAVASWFTAFRFDADAASVAAFLPVNLGSPPISS